MTGRIMMALFVLLPAALAGQNDWRSYGQDAAGTRYSSLTQITAGNVAALKRAWDLRYRRTCQRFSRRRRWWLTG